MIEIMETNVYGIYNFAGNSKDEIALTGAPLTVNGKIIKALTTGSSFLNVDTKKVKFYDRESNEWR